MWLFYLFILSIFFLVQPSSLLLSWVNYNSKRFKPNRLPNLFRRSFYLLGQTMAGLCTYYSSCRNPLFTGNDELAGAPPRVLTKSSGSQVSTFHVPILGPAFNIALAPAVPSTNNKLFKKFIKSYLRTQVQLSTLFLSPI